MRKQTLTAGAITLLAFGSSLAFAQEMMMMRMKPGMEMSTADKGYMDAMQKMHQDTTVMEMTGDADGDFARMMIPHHQSAIAMAQVLLKQENVDPQIKTIAEAIVASQQKEIDEFKTWLAAHPE